MPRSTSILGFAAMCTCLALTYPVRAADAPCFFAVTIEGGATICGFPFGPVAMGPRTMNNLGHWAGYNSQCDVASIHHAVTWVPELGLQQLATPPGTFRSRALGINDQGTVVGEREGDTDGESHGQWACIWIGDEFIEIPPLGGSPSHSGANAVNNSNTVVGWRNVSDGSGGQAIRSAFVWKDGVLTNIDPLPYGFSEASATDINDSGVVVGNMSDSVSSGVAFRLIGTRMNLLQPLPGAAYGSTGPGGVNEQGEVAGFSYFEAKPGVPAYTIPTLWRGTVPEALPLLENYASGTCIGTNSQGLILGRFVKPTVSGLPFTRYGLWIDGVPYSLGSLLSDPPSPSPTPFALNESGQLLCTGGGTEVAPSGSAWVMSPTSSSADLNSDCIVDGIDLATLLLQWGAMGSASADLDHDGMVDGADLGALLGAWTVRSNSYN